MSGVHDKQEKHIVLHFLRFSGILFISLQVTKLFKSVSNRQLSSIEFYDLKSFMLSFYNKIFGYAITEDHH